MLLSFLGVKIYDFTHVCTLRWSCLNFEARTLQRERMEELSVALSRKGRDIPSLMKELLLTVNHPDTTISLLTMKRD